MYLLIWNQLKLKWKWQSPLPSGVWFVNLKKLEFESSRPKIINLNIIKSNSVEGIIGNANSEGTCAFVQSALYYVYSTVLSSNLPHTFDFYSGSSYFLKIGYSGSRPVRDQQYIRCLFFTNHIVWNLNFFTERSRPQIWNL